MPVTAGLTIAQTLELAVRRGTWVAVRLEGGATGTGKASKIFSTALREDTEVIVLTHRDRTYWVCFVDEVTALWGAETEEELLALVPKEVMLSEAHRT